MNRSSMFARVALAIALLFVAAPLVDAQDRDRDREGRRGRRGGGFGRGGFGFGRGGFTMDKLTLVRLEQVQKEITVTEEQKPKIDDVLAAYNEERRGDRGRGEGRGRGRGDFQRPSEEERAKREKERLALVAKYEKKLDKVLEKAQITRLNEIALQQKGTRALTEGPVAASLKLNEEQVGKIKAVFKSQEDERQKLFQSLRDGGGGREGFAEMREKMEKIQKDADKAALAVLSEEQQKKFTEMKGKKLEVEFRRGGFGRGGEGRGRGRGGEGRGGQRRRPPVDDA